MARKVYLDVNFELILSVDDGVQIPEIMPKIALALKSKTEATMEDAYIKNWDVVGNTSPE